MMVLFAGFLLSVVPAAFAAAFFRRKVESILPAALMSNAVLLYIFFLFGAPWGGVWTIFLLNTLLLIPVIIKAAGDMKNFAANFFTPALAAYLFLTLLFFVLNRGRLFYYWDEFTHWGLVAKAVWQNHQLPCELGNLLNFPSYPPAMVMLQYLYLTANGSFSESVVYFAGFQLFAAIFSLILWQRPWEKWRENSLLVLLIWLLPQAFIGYFYSTYVDGMLAMVFCYALVLIFAGEKPTWGTAALLLPTVTFLTLIKGSGSGLAVLVVAALLIQLWFCRRKLRPADALIPVVVLCGMIFAGTSWKYMVTASSCKVSFSGSAISAGAIWDALVNNIPSHSWTVISRWLVKFASNLPWSPEFFEYAPGALPMVIVFALFAFYFARKSPAPEQSRSLRTVGVLAIIFTTIFAVTLLIYYIFDFALFEALCLASFERYINTLVLAFYMAIVILARERISDEQGAVLWFDLPLLILPPILYCCCRLHVFLPELLGKYANMAAAGIYLGILFVRQKQIIAERPRLMRLNIYTVLLLLPLVMLPQIFIFTNRMVRRDYAWMRGEVQLAADQLKKHLHPGDKVTVIHQGNHGLTFFMMRYCLFPDVPVYPWSIGGKQHEQDMWSADKTPADFASDILAHGGILYLHSVDERFRRRYQEVFATGTTIGSGQFYTPGDDGKIRLLSNRQLDLGFEKFNFFMPVIGRWRNICHRQGALECKIPPGDKGKLVLALSHTKLLHSAVYRKISLRGESRCVGTLLQFISRNGVRYSTALPPQGEFEIDWQLPDEPLIDFQLHLSSDTGGKVIFKSVVLSR